MSDEPKDADGAASAKDRPDSTVPGRRRSIALASIITGTAAIVAIVAAVRAMLPAAPALSIESFNVVEVMRPREVTYSADTQAPPDETDEGEVAAVHIGFRNQGTAPAYVTRAILTIRAHEVLQTCAEIGDAILITSSVDVQLPYEQAPVPWTHDEPLDFRVAANDLDRIELTFSIEDLPPAPAPAAYSVDVMLEDDSGRAPIRAGTARLLLPIPNAEKALAELAEEPYGGITPSEGCTQGNLAVMEEVMATSTLPRAGSAPHFEELLTALRGYENGDYYVAPDD